MHTGDAGGTVMLRKHKKIKITEAQALADTLFLSGAYGSPRASSLASLALCTATAPAPHLLVLR
jgi:hypothetical protein